MSIYKDNCLAYLKIGYSVTPSKGKKPAIKGWTDFCERLPTEEEVQEWTNIQDANIDVCLGEASGIIALDVDCEDEDLMSQIDYLLPTSPVEKIGKKGFTRFFQYSGETTQVIHRVNDEGKKEVVLELLSTGKKTTIPPSIHPEGMEYKWTDKSLLNVKRSELPKFPPLLIAHITSKLKTLQSTSYGGSARVESGRNSALSAYTAQLIKDKVDIETAIQKLIEHDKDTNEIPLFSDSKENKSSIPLINASRFFISHLESINIKREREKLPPELPLRSLSQVITTPIKKIKENLELPTPTGTLNKIQEYITARSFVEQPAFALSASLVFLSTLVSRKFTFQGVTPNIYVLNVAESGSGKDSCQQSLKTLLHAAKAQHFFGAATYPSEASILVNLDTQPTRIDIIDEASSFLKSASSGGASYQTGIGDLLCELYSCANDHYLGKILASNGGQRVGECHRPHLNILCSTTYKGLSEAINHSTLEKGLFARFFTFFGDNNKPAKRIKSQVNIPSDLIETLQYWVNFENPESTGNVQANQPVYQIKITEEADKELDTYFHTLDSLRLNTGSTGVLRPVAARLYQQMLKIILLSAVSNTKKDGIPKVSLEDVQFGYKFIMFFYENISKFIKESLWENPRVRYLNKILALIKEGGNDGITSSTLIREFQSLEPSKRTDIIKDLYESKQIVMEKGINENGEPETIFKAVI